MSDNARCQAHIFAIRMSQRMFARTIGREFTPAQLSFRAGDSRSNIIYLAGHVTWAVDGMVGRLLGATPVMAKAHHELFSMSVTPKPNASDYPAIKDVLAQFNTATENVCAALAKLKDSDLDRPTPEGPTAKMFPTYDAALHGIAFHTNYHLGQIALLMRAQGMESAFGV